MSSASDFLEKWEADGVHGEWREEWEVGVRGLKLVMWWRGGTGRGLKGLIILDQGLGFGEICCGGSSCCLQWQLACVSTDEGLDGV